LNITQTGVARWRVPETGGQIKIQRFGRPASSAFCNRKRNLRDIGNSENNRSDCTGKRPAGFPAAFCKSCTCQIPVENL